MQTTFRSFFLCLLFSLQVTHATDQDTLHVQLETGAQLMPVYLSRMQSENTRFDASYLTKIESLIRFDLTHNGMTTLLKPTDSLEKATTALGPSSAWAASGAYYVIIPKVVETTLKVQVYSVTGTWIKTIDKIPLTGEFSADRQQVHVASDTIHKLLFGKEGIARTRVLYTIRHKIPGKEEWTSEMWEADYDGGNSRRVLTNVGYAVTPQYFKAAPGKRPGSFFFVSYQTGQPKIFIGSLQGNGTKRLSALPGNQLMPTLSHQRNKIAFISDVTGNPEVFVQEFSLEEGVKGKPRQIFSARHATQGTPSFSPNGEQVAFVSDKDGSAKIYVVDVTPPGVKLSDVKARLITRFNKGCTAPAWSPDGQKIAYSALIAGARQIVVYDFITKKERQLTFGSGNKENPSWAPNSLHLVYNVGGEANSQLFFLSLNQPTPVKITAGNGDKRFPSWEPWAFEVH